MGKVVTFPFLFSGLRIRVTLTAKNEKGAEMIRALTGNNQKETNAMQSKEQENDPVVRAALVAELAKRGVCEELSTVTLINRVLNLCAEAGHDSLPFFGCVVCGDSRCLSTHVVPGYGNVCSAHAEHQERAVAETWAVEGRELHKRGIRRPPR